ncbi:MAG: hypothetical protein J6J43_05285 [Oscillospiraceae bacterium]|nr:hypothetical protein [Oscillospiraceae bacterium]
MWVIFGSGAVLLAVLGVIRRFLHCDGTWCSYLSLSLTALTLCAFCTRIGIWVTKEDWSALADVMPGMSKVFWILTLASIVINAIGLFRKKQ